MPDRAIDREAPTSNVVKWWEYVTVVPGEQSSTLTVSYDLDDKKMRIPSGEGRGAFRELTQRDNLQSVPIGTLLKLGFSDGKIPTSVTLSDLILDENGSEAFPEIATEVSNLEAHDGQYSIYVGTNQNAMYYDHAEAYKPGGIIRGFLLECSFETGETELYAIAVQTDVAFGVEAGPSSTYLAPMCGTGIEVFANSKPQKSADGMELVFTMNNNTNKDFAYGEEPMLLRFEGPEAKAVPLRDGIGWNDIAYTLKGKKSARVEVDLEELYGSLLPGYYRFSRVLTDMQTGESQTVSADFVLN